MTRAKKQELDLGVKVIRPYKVQPGNMRTLEGSLFSEGHAFIPNTYRTFHPKFSSGIMRTGLDPDAIKINAILDPEAKKQERERISSLKAYYEALLNEDLSPNSSYYDNIKENGVSLEDGDNIFNLANPVEAVNYYWIMETGMVANNISDLESGKLDPKIVRFYVHDSDEDTKKAFERKRRINEVKVMLDRMTNEERSQTAKLLGLAILPMSTVEEVYNILDDFLGKTVGSLGYDPIEKFKEVTSLPKEIKETRAFVQDLIKMNVVRLKKGSVVEGNQVWAKDVTEFESFLLDKNNSDIYAAFRDKLKNKISLDTI